MSLNLGKYAMVKHSLNLIHVCTYTQYIIYACVYINMQICIYIMDAYLYVRMYVSIYLSIYVGR